MAHVTFIHGIANKPAQDELLAIWLNALAASGGPDLKPPRITTTMVYWADVLYESPLAEEALEAAEAEPALAEATAPPPTTASVREASLAAGLAMKFGMVAALAEAEAASEGQLERVLLPDFVKKRLMEAYLRDVHHYLFNVTFSPRAGVRYAVQDEIRGRLVRALLGGARQPGPHVLVSHSMGTVIAYDCLKRVAACPAVDGLMTIGSPLGLDEIQDQLRPEWTREEGFPGAKLRGRWVNVFDRLDPVAGFDPLLANDYLQAGGAAVADISEPNFGRWRHDITKYLGGPRLRAALTELLGL